MAASTLRPSLKGGLFSMEIWDAELPHRHVLAS